MAHYEDKIPCEVTIYGSNSDNPDGEWTKLGSFSESRFLEAKDRWAYHSTSTYYYNTLVDLEAADPVCMEITFPVTPTKYRYLKLVVDEVFIQPNYTSNYVDYNPNKYVTMHELEVYVKKDEQ